MRRIERVVISAAAIAVVALGIAFFQNAHPPAAPSPNPAPPDAASEGIRLHSPSYESIVKRDRAFPRGDQTGEVLRGQVLGPDSSPVTDAIVYLLPKVGPGVGAVEVLGHCVVDEQGHWSMPEWADPRGRWVCANSDSYLPGFLDGDQVLREKNNVLVLQSGRCVAVHLTGDRAVGELGTTVKVDACPDSQAKRFPGPEDETSPYRTVVLAEGVASCVVPIGTKARVRVRVSRRGEVPSPAEVWLEPGHDLAEFTLSPSCSVRIRVCDAQTKAPLTSGVKYQILRNGEVVAGGYGRSPDGVLQATDHLGAEEYAVRVYADGYVERLYPVAFASAGAVAELLVELAPSVAAGMELQWESDIVLEGSPYVLVREVTKVPPVWTVVQKVESGETGSAVIQVRCPGFYDAIVADRHSGRAAYVPPIDLRQARVPARVRWMDGLFVRLEEVVSGDEAVVEMVIRDSALGSLPVFIVGPESDSLIDEGDEMRLGPAVRLGPYPLESVHMEGYATSGRDNVRRWFSRSAVGR